MEKLQTKTVSKDTGKYNVADWKQRVTTLTKTENINEKPFKYISTAD